MFDHTLTCYYVTISIPYGFLYSNVYVLAIVCAKGQECNVFAVLASEYPTISYYTSVGYVIQPLLFDPHTFGKPILPPPRLNW